MKGKIDLTLVASQGYAGITNPHVRYTREWFAHRIGEHLRQSGRTEPKDVRMGRGYQIHANDMLFAINHQAEVSRVN